MYAQPTSEQRTTRTRYNADASKGSSGHTTSRFNNARYGLHASSSRTALCTNTAIPAVHPRPRPRTTVLRVAIDRRPSTINNHSHYHYHWYHYHYQNWHPDSDSDARAGAAGARKRARSPSKEPKKVQDRDHERAKKGRKEQRTSEPANLRRRSSLRFRMQKKAPRPTYYVGTKEAFRTHTRTRDVSTGN